jgi:hypothetical protein
MKRLVLRSLFTALVLAAWALSANLASAQHS